MLRARPLEMDRASPEDVSRLREWCLNREISVASEVSALNGTGVTAAAAQIADRVAALTRRRPGEVLLTRLTDLQVVEACLGHLERAQEAPAEDLFAADLRLGLGELEPLAGKTPPDELLGRIFSTFCIGK